MGVPRHVAIIMDGNGRWARKRNQPAIMGHRAGIKTVDDITEASAGMGIKALTLYTFSTENWKRPRKEVDALMALLGQCLDKYGSKIHKNNIRFNAIGRLGELPQSLQGRIDDTKALTGSNTGMVLTLALNYGGRQEILDAFKEACSSAAASGEDISLWDEDTLAKHLYTAGLPELDLVIRTSGEMRVSNFLLWQSAYSEFYVTETLWPDFNAAELTKALDEYSDRERRFGG
ncbi:MAG: isoprenyl transferase [Candidatus Tantalella remota]|nr:isoprenyl transferase [Candidatus Tantalella remota]